MSLHENHMSVMSKAKRTTSNSMREEIHKICLL